MCLADRFYRAVSAQMDMARFDLPEKGRGQLRPDQVRVIREYLEKGLSRLEISNRTNVGEQIIARIANGSAYADY